MSKLRAVYFCLKQMGFSESLLKHCIENNKNPLIEIFENRLIEYKRIASKNDLKLSEKKSSFDFYIEKIKNYYIKNPQEKIYFKYNANIFDEIIPSKIQPLFLYTVGKEEFLSNTKKRVAIIGTRKPSELSISHTKILTQKLVVKGNVIVSGLAEGIDSIAHTSALENKGETVAVLPTNFLKIYPKHNENLANEIKENGLLLSCIGPFEHTYRSSFLDRNRLVAAISDEIFVIETNLKSGTMNTIRNASEQNKKIWFLDQKDNDVNEKLLSYGGEMISNIEILEG